MRFHTDYEGPFSRNLKGCFSCNHSDPNLKMNEVKRSIIRLNGFENIIAGIGEAFPNLEELSILSDSIKFIERHDFADLSQLKELIVTMYQLEFLAYDVFYNLPDLEFVSFSDGKLENLHENIFLNLRNLKKLVIIGHRIAALEENLFVNNPLLEEISFDRNELEIIKVDFRKRFTNHILELCSLSRNFKRRLMKVVPND